MSIHDQLLAEVPTSKIAAEMLPAIAGRAKFGRYAARAMMRRLMNNGLVRAIEERGTVRYYKPDVVEPDIAPSIDDDVVVLDDVVDERPSHRQRLVDAMPDSPDLAMTVGQISDQLEITPQHVRTITADSVRRGEIARIGKGGRCDPYRFWSGINANDDGQAHDDGVNAPSTRKDEPTLDGQPVITSGVVEAFKSIPEDEDAAHDLARAYATVIKDLRRQANVARSNVGTFESVVVVLSRILDGES